MKKRIDPEVRVNCSCGASWYGWHAIANPVIVLHHYPRVAIPGVSSGGKAHTLKVITGAAAKAAPDRRRTSKADA